LDELYPAAPKRKLKVRFRSPALPAEGILCWEPTLPGALVLRSDLEGDANRKISVLQKQIVVGDQGIDLLSPF
jgi:hypothetical protein